MNQDPDQRLILSSMMARLSSQIREKAFLIPKEWWDAWALFQSGLGSSSPPGPINNFSLVHQYIETHRSPVQKKEVLMTVDNSLTSFTDWEFYALQLNLIPSVDYKIVSQEMWKYLLSHYGGGPQIPIYMLDEKMNGPTFVSDDGQQFYLDDSPLSISLVYQGSQSFVSHKHIFSALMTVSLMIEESKRIVSQLLNNYRASDLNVVIETQDKNFLMESMVNTFSCLADWEINENSKVYVFRKGEDELRQDMEIKKAAMIQITFKAQEETKEEYYEEGFFGSKTSFNVSEQFKQSFKSILKSPKFKEQNSRYKPSKQVHFYDQGDTETEFDLHNQGFYQDEDQDQQLMMALQASLKDSGLSQAPPTQPPPTNKQFEMQLFKTTESNDCVVEIGDEEPVETENLVEVYQQQRGEEFKKAKERGVESMQKDKLKIKRRSVVEVSRGLSKLARKLQNKY